MFNKLIVGIIFLVLSFTAGQVMADELSSNSQTSKPHETKYPPYPDVWDWQIPNLEAYVPGSLRTYLLDNGDVLIVYTQRKTSDLKRKKADVSDGVESKQVTLFGGLTVLDEPSNVRLMRSPEKPLKLSDGSVVKRLKSDWDRDKDSGKLKDKTYIRAGCDHYHDCYIGPAKCNLSRDSDKNYRIARKVIFLLIDKPKRWEGAYYNEVDECHERDHKLKVRVVSLSGGILPLEDGSFLLVDGELGRIIRFNPDFTTGFPLLNKKLFVFDFDDDKDLDFVKSPLFMPKINGKNYEDKQGKIKMQEVLDDLYNYLIKLSKGGK
jgi:hypothetical protein